MKNLRKLIALVLCVSMMSFAWLLTSCSSEVSNETSEVTSEETSEEETVDEIETTTEEIQIDADSSLGMRIYAAFLEGVNNGDSKSDIVAALSSSNLSGYECLSMDVEEGYINGFDDQIVGFTSGTMIGPVIGSVPMIIYVFESDNPDALKDDLLAHADPRWNICTEADETVCEVSGNYVFFCMVPNE